MILPLLTHISRADRALVGGKAANLGELASLGLQVPPGFVIPVPFGDTFLDQCVNLRPSLLSPDPRESSLATYQALIDTPLDTELERAIFRSFKLLELESVSVRSSATAEDSADLSFAGIFESILNVREGDLISAIKRCWLSALAPRVHSYRERHDLHNKRIHMGVVVQELIEPLVSGVCFTSHPITGDADCMFVEAAWGFGDLIVSGRVTPDSYVYHRRSRTLVEKTIHSQETARVLIGGELCDVAVDEARRSSEKLPDSLLRQLADACQMIVEHYRQPQDIEFAVRQDAIYFLQSRPITTQP